VVVKLNKVSVQCRTPRTCSLLNPLIARPLFEEISGR